MTTSKDNKTIKIEKEGDEGDLNAEALTSDRCGPKCRPYQVNNGSNHETVGLGYAANKQASEDMKNTFFKSFFRRQTTRRNTNTMQDSTSVGVKLSDKEERLRSNAHQYKIGKVLKSDVSALLIFLLYLVKLESVVSILLTVGITLYWYFDSLDNQDEWSGSGVDWVVLGFALVTPITVSIGMAFRRRELALLHISRIRSFSFQIYQAHAIWDWDSGQGREKATKNQKKKINWLDHTDQVLEHLVGMGDELCRFLTLPTCSRTYHRMLKSGRREAAEIVEVQYRLFDSLYTKRMVKLTQLVENLKSAGLGASEASRLRQYERHIGENIEGLRMIKMYRTPQALRSFARLFTLVLPPMYAASFSSLAFEMKSLTMGILFAVITPLCLTALFESMTNMEDPFVGWTTLDGIDVAEEFEVLHWHQLNNARNDFFPDAQPFCLPSQDNTLSQMPIVERDGDIFDRKLLGSTKLSDGGTSLSRLSMYARNN